MMTVGWDAMLILSVGVGDKTMCIFEGKGGMRQMKQNKNFFLSDFIIPCNYTVFPDRQLQL